jgi:multidrug efflux system membrane fusion protein
VRVSATPVGGTAQEGGLVFVDNAVDTTNGTILLKGSFENVNHSLWPGQFVSVTMQLYVEQNALVIPGTAVVTGQQGTAVFVVDSSDTAAQRPVTVARMAGDLAVISDGLEPGDRVVTDGQLRLVPGAKVDIKNGTPEQPS